MSSRAETETRLTDLAAQLTKVQAELDAALHPPTRTFVISALRGVFADDVGVQVGDTANVIVVRGRVGQLSTDGVWGDIADGTIVEYWATRAGVPTNHVVEFFTGS
jgi:selenophosphate synthetase-related protein